MRFNYGLQLKISCFIIITYIRQLHTYIIGHYNPSVRIIDLVSYIFLSQFSFFFNFEQMKKPARDKSGEYGGWGMISFFFVFGQKLTFKHRCVWAGSLSWLQNPWLVFQQFCPLPTNCFAESAYNFKVIFLIERRRARIHDAPRHWNRRKQWAKPSHLTELVVLFLVCTLALGWLVFIFNVIAIHPWFVKRYELFEQIWIVVER